MKRRTQHSAISDVTQSSYCPYLNNISLVNSKKSLFIFYFVLVNRINISSAISQDFFIH